MSPSLRELWLHRRSDEALAALAAEGEQRAFAVLVDRHRQALLSIATRTVGRDRAEDVLQQGLLNAWSALRNGTEVRNVRAWMAQIVRHGAWKDGRGNECCELPASLSDGSSLASTFEASSRLRELVGHVTQLPAQQRLALVQTALEGRSTGEVATHLSISEGAVRQLVYRARTRLQHAMLTILPAPLLSWLTRRGVGENDTIGNAAGGGGLVAGTLGAAKLAAVVLTIGAAGLGVRAGLADAQHDSDPAPGPGAAALVTGTSGGLIQEAASLSRAPASAAAAAGKLSVPPKAISPVNSPATLGENGPVAGGPIASAAQDGSGRGPAVTDGAATAAEVAPRQEPPPEGPPETSETSSAAAPAEAELTGEQAPSEAAPVESAEAQLPSGESAASPVEAG